MLNRIIDKIQRHRNTGTHTNNNYNFYADLIEELTAINNRLEPLVMPKIAEISRLIFEKLKSYSFGIDGVTDFGANKKEFTEIIQKTLIECISKNYNKD